MAAIVFVPLVLMILSWWWVYVSLGYYSSNHPLSGRHGTTTTNNDPANAYSLTTSITATTSTTTTNNNNRDNNNYNIPIQVYILAGQSNMVGMGSITHLDKLIQYNGTGSAGSSPYQNEYRDTLWNGTNYKERDDVYIVYQTHSGKLTVSRTAGYAGGSDHFGPEVLFGWTVAEQQKQLQGNRTMILLIKVAYGGRDLAIDFRPPSAGIGNYSNVIDDPDHYGWEYRVMINDTKHALNTIDQYIPNFVQQYNGTYELKGFVWFQGWNDLLLWQKVHEYESNLAHLIRDIRTDLNHSDLPFGTFTNETIFSIVC